MKNIREVIDNLCCVADALRLKSSHEDHDDLFDLGEEISDACNQLEELCDEEGNI